MTFEVVASRIGMLTTRDMPPEKQPRRCSFVVVVLAADGMPVLGAVRVGEMPGGRGRHRGWICPMCGGAKYRLFAMSEGGLGCGRCSSRRSRHQVEHRSRGWRAHSGELEDRLLRGIPGHRDVIPERILAMVQRLAAADADRAHKLEALAADAVALTRTPRILPATEFDGFDNDEEEGSWADCSTA